MNRTKRHRRARRHTAIASIASVGLILALGACGSDDDTELQQAQQDLAAQTARADAAEKQLNDITAKFPITVEASLEDFDLIGGYTLSLTQAYCDDLPDCGAKRPDIQADIVQGSNGLELKIPNVLTAGLFAINGSLFAVTDSNLIAQPCGTTNRTSRVSITMFADAVTIESDGSRSVSTLGASLLVEVNQVAECPEGVIFFAAELTPN
jgi:hypothetical protein